MPNNDRIATKQGLLFPEILVCTGVTLRRKAMCLTLGRLGAGRHRIVQALDQLLLYKLIQAKTPQSLSICCGNGLESYHRFGRHLFRHYGRHFYIYFERCENTVGHVRYDSDPTQKSLRNADLLAFAQAASCPAIGLAVVNEASVFTILPIKHTNSALGRHTAGCFTL